ncbi:hypothetical protein HYH03_007183 [Edaphochlamys debaryana]|uniref:EGF-like domain-containing protein n=1 Tax=Edaphochlamys debaryana TaxID=47281 RepID=A0A836C069_9CHLO|nr:hypothetical protein HYH03_007183 [Edaphochlamys debaryana]|eukprot:KAG2494667.1 hypothetical protein HYH03_007183 [Edaphochlamys debaryana]
MPDGSLDYKCTCRVGYYNPDPRNCADIDECAVVATYTPVVDADLAMIDSAAASSMSIMGPTVASLCGPTALSANPCDACNADGIARPPCINTAGSFTLQNPCGASANCTNLPGNYTCSCPTGTVLVGGDWPTCWRDQCPLVRCKSNMVCSMVGGRPRCTCPTGSWWDPYKETCVRTLHPCVNYKCGTNQVCMLGPNGPYCACRAGPFVPDKNTTFGCVLDTCPTKICPRGFLCQMVNNKPTCYCPPPLVTTADLQCRIGNLCGTKNPPCKCDQTCEMRSGYPVSDPCGMIACLQGPCVSWFGRPMCGCPTQYGFTQVKGVPCVGPCEMRVGATCSRGQTCSINPVDYSASCACDPGYILVQGSSRLEPATCYYNSCADPNACALGQSCMIQYGGTKLCYWIIT